MAAGRESKTELEGAVEERAAKGEAVVADRLDRRIGEGGGEVDMVMRVLKESLIGRRRKRGGRRSMQLGERGRELDRNVESSFGEILTYGAGRGRLTS